jgi:hypothetical protein
LPSIHKDSHDISSLEIKGDIDISKPTLVVKGSLPKEKLSIPKVEGDFKKKVKGGFKFGFEESLRNGSRI